MKNLIFSLLLMGSASAWASPFVCFTSDIKSAQMQFEDEAVIELAGWPSCKNMHRTSVALTATSLALATGGIYTACTGVGVAATVWLEGGAVGAQTLSLIVGELPCDNSAQEADIKRMAKQQVCEELSKIGIACSQTL